MAVLGLDGHCAAGRHGVARIDREIENDELDLRRIDLCGPEPVGQTQIHPYRPAEGTLQQVLHACHHRVQVHCTGQQGLSTCERKQVSRQRCATHRRCPGGSKTFIRARLQRAGRLDKVDVADHHGQQVVEVVRDAACELANRLKPLSLVQRCFGAFPLCHLVQRLLMLMLHLARTARQQQQQAYDGDGGERRDRGETPGLPPPVRQQLALLHRYHHGQRECPQRAYRGYPDAAIDRALHQHSAGYVV